MIWGRANAFKADLYIVLRQRFSTLHPASLYPVSPSDPCSRGTTPDCCDWLLAASQHHWLSRPSADTLTPQAAKGAFRK